MYILSVPLICVLSYAYELQRIAEILPKVTKYNSVPSKWYYVLSLEG